MRGVAAFILHVGMLLLMPVSFCMLHAASLSLHLQRKLRSERRMLLRARDSFDLTEQGKKGGVLLMQNGDAMFESVAISITNADEVRDSEGCFVRYASSKRTSRPVLGRRCLLHKAPSSL
jgi:hypothetical protein